MQYDELLLLEAIMAMMMSKCEKSIFNVNLINKYIDDDDSSALKANWTDWSENNKKKTKNGKKLTKFSTYLTNFEHTAVKVKLPTNPKFPKAFSKQLSKS